MSYRIGTLKISYIQLIYGIIGIACVVPLMKDVSSAASIISYFPDFLNVGLFILAVKKSGKSFEITETWTPLILIAILLLFDVFELLILGQNILLFLWGFRNQYRFILFFVSCIILCDTSDLIKVDCFLRRLLLINFVVVLIELSLGFVQDCLSGTFGITQGSNGSANLFLSVCFASLLVDYLYKKIKTSHILFYGVAILLWAALAELKYFIILAIVMVFICFVITQRKNISKRAFRIVIFSVIGGITSVVLLGYIRPYYKNFFRFENIIWYAKHIDMGVGGFGRLTAIPITNKLFFDNNLLREFFGIGLGSAEYSSIGFLNSHFHEMYGMYNYDTLFYSMTYIERGLFGLAWYAIFYLNSLKKALSIKSVILEDTVLLKKNIICIIVAFLVSFYDDSLRRASGGFIMFFVLAIPYVIAKQYRTKEIGKEFYDT